MGALPEQQSGPVLFAACEWSGASGSVRGQARLSALGVSLHSTSGARKASQRAFAFPLRTRARSPAGPVDANLGSQMNIRQQRGEELGFTLLMSLRARWGRPPEMLWIDGDPDCG